MGRERGGSGREREGGRERERREGGVRMEAERMQGETFQS